MIDQSIINEIKKNHLLPEKSSISIKKNALKLALYIALEVILVLFCFSVFSNKIATNVADNSISFFEFVLYFIPFFLIFFLLVFIEKYFIKLWRYRETYVLSNGIAQKMWFHKNKAFFIKFSDIRAMYLSVDDKKEKNTEKDINEANAEANNEVNVNVNAESIPQPKAIVADEDGKDIVFITRNRDILIAHNLAEGKDLYNRLCQLVKEAKKNNPLETSTQQEIDEKEDESEIAAEHTPETMLAIAQAIADSKTTPLGEKILTKVNSGYLGKHMLLSMVLFPLSIICLFYILSLVSTGKISDIFTFTHILWFYVIIWLPIMLLSIVLVRMMFPQYHEKRKKIIITDKRIIFVNKSNKVYFTCLADQLASCKFSKYVAWTNPKNKQKVYRYALDIKTKEESSSSMELIRPMHITELKAAINIMLAIQKGVL